MTEECLVILVGICGIVVLFAMGIYFDYKKQTNPEYIKLCEKRKLSSWLDED